MPALVETGVYNIERGLPWHGLGTPNEGFFIAADLLVAAGLDWKVSKQVIYSYDGYSYDGDGDTFNPIDDNFAIVRDVDAKVLGIVGNRYEPAQNDEVLSFMDNIIGSGQAVYDTAWSLRGGKTVAITAELNETGYLPEGEEIKTYLTASNNHDGTGKIRIIVSPIRVVCMNTLAIATKQAKYTWERKHTQNWGKEENLAEARDTLELASVYQKYITDTANTLIMEAFPRFEFAKLANTLTIGELKQGEDPTPQAQNRFESLMALYTNSDNLANIKDTKWGAFNAVAEWVDYDGKYRGKDILDKRAESIMFGRGVDTKTAALNYLIAA